MYVALPPPSGVLLIAAILNLTKSLIGLVLSTADASYIGRAVNLSKAGISLLSFAATP